MVGFWLCCRFGGGDDVGIWLEVLEAMTACVIFV